MNNRSEVADTGRVEALERESKGDSTLENQRKVFGRLGRFAAYTSPKMAEILFCGAGRHRSSAIS